MHAPGGGVGTELDYDFKKDPGDTAHHTGQLRAYHISDSGTYDSGVEKTPVPEDSRGRLWLRHRAQWNDDWRTDGEFYWLSDSTFLREYFEREYNNEKAPESYIFTRYRKDNLWAGLTFKKQVNSFMNDLDEQPSLELDWLGVPLGRLVYDAKVILGYYKQGVSDELPALHDSPNLWRAYTEHMLSLPFEWGLLRITPFVRALATYASEGVDGSAKDRIGLGGGIEASTDFSRSYAMESDTFKLNRLRHVVTPFIRYEELSVNRDAGELIQLGAMEPWPQPARWDGIHRNNVDAIDDLSITTVGLRQRLQTKRGGPANWHSEDWIELDTSYVRRTDKTLGILDDDYIDLDFVWNIFPRVSLFSKDNRFSLNKNGTSVYNAGMGVEFGDANKATVSYDVVENLTKNCKAEMDFKLSDRYFLKVTEQYDFDPGNADHAQSLGSSMVLRRLLHKWVLDIGMGYSKSRNGSGIVFGFGPAGSDVLPPALGFTGYQ